MKVGCTVLAEALSRVSYSVAPPPQRGIRINNFAMYDSLCLFSFSKHEKKLRLFARSGGTFALATLDVETEDGEQETFSHAVVPSILLDTLKFASGEVQISSRTVKDKDGLSIVFENKGKSFINDFNDSEEHFGEPEIEVTGEELLIDTFTLKQALDITCTVASGGTLGLQQTVSFANKDNRLCMFATDGIRLVFIKDIAPALSDLSDGGLYYKDATVLNRMIPDEEGESKLFISNDRVFYKDIDFVAGFLWSNGSLNVEDVISRNPISQNTVITLDVAGFISALRVASLFGANEEFVVLKLYNNNLFIMSRSNEIGDTRWLINNCAKIESNREDNSIGFNSKYLMQFINHLKPSSVRINLSDKESPFYVFTENENILYVIMPYMMNDEHWSSYMNEKLEQLLVN